MTRRGAGADLRRAASVRDALGVAERGRFGIRLGLGRTQRPAPRAGRPAAGGARRARRRHERQGQRPGPGRQRAPRRRAAASARRPSPISSPIASGSRSTAGPSTRRRSRALVAEVLPVADRVARRHGEPTEFELLTAMVFRQFARCEARRRPRRGRARRAARRDPRLGRRGRGDHERRPRSHGPARPDDRGDRPREGGDHRARRPGRRRGATGEALARDPAPGAARWACPSRGHAARLLDWDRDGIDGGAARARTDARRAPRPPPGGERGGRRRRPRRPRGGRDRHAPTPTRGGAATRTPRGPAGSSCWQRATAATCCSTGPTTRPVRRRSRRRSTTCARSSTPGPLTLVTATMADKDVDGVVAALRARRRWPGARVDRDRRGRAARAWRAEASSPRAGGRATRRPAPVLDGRDDPTGARPRRSTRRRGPVVVAGSLYLVGAAGRLVDDPVLRDPSLPTIPRPDDTSPPTRHAGADPDRPRCSRGASAPS